MKILLLIELLKPKIRNLQIRNLQELDFHLSWHGGSYIL